MRQEQYDVIRKEHSSYMDIFQKRPTRYRIYETLVYMIVMFLLASIMATDSGGYKVLAVISAIVIIGGAPIVYRRLLSPEYILKTTKLIIRMGSKERDYLLTEVERASEWKAVFRLQGKKETLMVSKGFLDKLDEQLARVRKTKRR